MANIAGFPTITITYGKTGKSTDRKHAEKLRDFVKAEGLDELIVFSHGWNNSAREAKALYRGVLKHLKISLAEDARFDARKVGLLAVVWPSKRFKAFEKEDDSLHGGGAASAEPEIDDPMVDARRLSRELAQDLPRAKRKRMVDAAEAAIEDADHWPAFLATLEDVMPQDDGAGDEADKLLFGGIKDPQEALEQFDFIDVESEDDMQPGGAAGGFFQGAAGAVGSVLNFATYYVMKRRAGLVGQNGLAQTLSGIRTVKPGLRIHFVGHSFGGRLVTMAALTLNGEGSAAPDSMTLLQAAFSHNSFSARYPPPNEPGFFRGVMTNTCVRGPILVTHTFNDIPVRVAYSIASALSGESAAFARDTPSQYGGLGANGAQHMGGEADDGTLHAVGSTQYDFKPGKVFNLLADKYIAGHSAVRVPEVGYALAKAMGTTL